MTRWILASASPRRRELLLQMGIREFEVHPAKGEESSAAADPGVYVEELARHKAGEVFRCVMEDLRSDGSCASDAGGRDPGDGGRAESAESGRLSECADREGPGEPGRGGLVPPGSLRSSAGGDRADRICVIGADTIVVCDDRILGKPRDRENAAKMIRMLQGRTHEVMTGVSLYWNEDGSVVDAAASPGVCRLCTRAHADGGDGGFGSLLQADSTQDVRYAETDDESSSGSLSHPDSMQMHVCSVTFHAVTRVHVAAMDEEEIQRYLATGEADDKAGAYGIQGAFGTFIEGIEGDYYNVVGLPIAGLYQTLKKNGLISCPG